MRQLVSLVWVTDYSEMHPAFISSWQKERLCSASSAQAQFQQVPVKVLFNSPAATPGCGHPAAVALIASLPALRVFTELILLPVLQDTSAVFCSYKIDVQRAVAKMWDDFFFCLSSCPHYPRIVDYFNSRNRRFCWASASTLQGKAFLVHWQKLS